MKQQIIGFHQDEFGDWVAELTCNHSQHVRHQPPFQVREWVTNEQGRRQRIGAELECRKCDDEPDFLRKNRALVRRYYDKLWNEWKLELIPKLLAEDFRFRGSLGVSARGHRAFTAYIDAIRSAFPEFHNHVDSMLAEDNRVVARVQYTAIHRGKIFGIEPTGNQISYAGVGIFVIGGRQLMSAWVLGDRYALMHQLGAVAERGSL
jgi:predicted ester cyclase